MLLPRLPLIARSKRTLLPSTVTIFVVLFGSIGSYLLFNSSAATPSVTVDFANQTNKSHPIPTDFFGVGGIGMNAVITPAGPYLPQAGFG